MGAEAEQARIDRYGEDIDIPKAYNKMADFYWYANNKSKALDAGQKAIKALKRKKNFSETDMAELKSRFQQYQDM